MKRVFALLFMLTLLLVACGTSVPNTPVAKPDKLHIVLGGYGFSGNSTSDKTITSGAIIQKLYDHIRSLPPASAGRICPAIGGERFQLTFSEKGKTILDAGADRSECGAVTIAKNDVRQTDDAFWSLLNQALSDG